MARARVLYWSWGGAARAVSPNLPDRLIETLLEVPDHAAANEVIMLPRLSRIGQREIRSARPEVADFTPNAETVPGSDVQTDATLEYPCG